MNNSLRIAAGVAAVAVVAVLAIILLPDRAPDVGVQTPGPTTSPSATQTAEVLSAEGPLTAGAYMTGPWFPVPIGVTVPDGWDAFEIGPTVTILSSRGPDGSAFLGFWIVQDAHRDPCNLGTVAESPVGPTVEDLAAALAGAPGFEATGPADARIGGLEGKFVQLLGPLPGCTEFELWTTPDGSGRGETEAPFERNRVWIVDAGGTRLVVAALDYPAAEGSEGTTEAELADLQRIIDSIQISP